MRTVRSWILAGSRIKSLIRSFVKNCSSLPLQIWIFGIQSSCWGVVSQNPQTDKLQKNGGPMGVRHLSFQVQAAFLLTILGRSVTNDAGIALGANGDILDLAANGLFQAFYIAAGSFRQVLVLAHGGDIAVPARQLDDNRLCIVQSLAGREAVGYSAVSQFVSWATTGTSSI